ncbi:saccharopine dehydrogenase [Crepidotus variabilis]|uniref:Saccharopine dehydrogenase [NAD(+), L-lysine-forming] n=1 Tax=Crepidotus variabilis TaxID=179855 RepID=A0A9P6EFU6_9AGAR|nr:saccharopine dehydrogenase [Crepidotus variabilis]
MARPSLWLRCETKQFERRTALTPDSAKKLVEAGFHVYVERDKQRIFKDAEYESVGCNLVDHSSWTTAPNSIPILGLKELPESALPLTHDHIHFGHCYKKQSGWSQHLARFYNGGGTLYDLEYLTDGQGRRVAAFGFHAGFAGAAVGALVFASRRSNEGAVDAGELAPFESEEALVNEAKGRLGEKIRDVNVLVIGALGRCGRGAVDLFRRVGVNEENIKKWDMAETAQGGPFQEILDVDIFVNCIYLNLKIPPFTTNQFIAGAGQNRRLSVIVDVSCDTTNPFNPLPIYNISTTFAKPTVLVDVGDGNPPLHVVSIDQLPSLVPREASHQFSTDLLPSLLELPSRRKSVVWLNAEKVFRENIQLAVEIEG